MLSSARAGPPSAKATDKTGYMRWQEKIAASPKEDLRSVNAGC